ncbi:MAG: hypothetical protein NTV92_02075 [Candidatus Bipolaricaulota bacterium]|nr:hypothetical protein [Candidatus Bipolaricaulota bacterium]
MRLRAILGVALFIAGALVSVMAVAVQGPFADTIVFDVRMTEEIALQDVAAGNTDVFFYGTSANVMHGLDQETLNKFEMYLAPASSDCFILNPYPGVAPYIAVNADTGVETFNPFAITAVRFAMHDIIDRGMICNQILQGGAEPCIIAVPPSAPGAFTLYLEASKLGQAGSQHWRQRVEGHRRRHGRYRGRRGAAGHGRTPDEGPDDGSGELGRLLVDV